MSNLGNVLALVVLILVIVLGIIGKMSMTMAVLLGMLALAVLLKPLPSIG